MLPTAAGCPSSQLPTPPHSFTSRIEAWLNTTRVPATSSRTGGKRDRSASPKAVISHPQKRPRQAASVPLPNTRETLLDPSNDGAPCPSPTTPIHSPSSAIASPSEIATPQRSEASSASRPRTPTDSLPSSRSSPDPLTVSRALQQCQIYQSEDRLKEHHPEFYNEITGKIGKPRLVEMTDDSVERFDFLRKKYAMYTEDTFLGAILPVMVPGSYRIPIAKRKADDMVQIESQAAGRKYIARSFEEDGGMIGINERLDIDFLPTKLPPDILRRLRKHNGNKDPKPNRIYSLDPERIPLPSGVCMHEDMRAILSLQEDAYHPFFIIEGKSNGGDVEEANMQALRGGTCMVYALRLFLDTIGAPSAPGLDTRTYAFSMTISPSIAQLWIHFAEVAEDGSVSYYMDILDAVPLIRMDQIPRLQRKCENIIRWGVTERKNELVEYHKLMNTWLIQRDSKSRERCALQTKEKEAATEAR